MISLKKYLDAEREMTRTEQEPPREDLAPVLLDAYRSALREMGSCSLDVCPALGGELKQTLGGLDVRLSPQVACDTVEATERDVRQELQDWGKRAADHARRQTGEVKDLLIVMARTAESVGERDQRCASQINAVTTRLEQIASLEDLTQIRASIEQSAAELKSSIDRMTAEGQAAVQELRAQVAGYEARLEEAEQIASRDALTGLGSRPWVEGQIERRCSMGVPHCVAILDIDGFKRVNDEHGHLVGDELLKQFAAELRSALRSADTLGRWGGDEFILLLDCDKSKARARIDRLREWVCGNYTVQGQSGPVKLRVEASIGLAEHLPMETMKGLLARADAEMYQQKAVARARSAASRA